MTSLDDIQQAAEGAKVCPDCGRPYAVSYPLWQCSDTACGLSVEWNEDGENHEDCINECLYATKRRLREDLAAQTEKAARAEQESATACARMRAQKAELRSRIAELEAALDNERKLSADYLHGRNVEAQRCDELLAERTRARNETLAALERLSELEAALGRAELENRAWRALAELQDGRYDVAFPGRRTMGDFGGSVGDRTKRKDGYVPRIFGEGATPGEAAIDIAAKLGLLNGA